MDKFYEAASDARDRAHGVWPQLLDLREAWSESRRGDARPPQVLSDLIFEAQEAQAKLTATLEQIHELAEWAKKEEAA